MQFSYDSGPQIDFIIRNSQVAWVETREKRKVDYTSADQIQTEAIIDTAYVLNLTLYDVTAAEKSNLESFFLSDEMVSLDNEDEVDSGDTYYTYSGNVYIRRPRKRLNFGRPDNQKDVPYWTVSMEIIFDSRASAVKP